MSLPTDRDARNALPIWDGVISYFPDAWAAIAEVSVLGNKQHNLGADRLFFNREVSKDHLNKVMRHLIDHETGAVYDADGTRHLAKAAWRILAALQVSIENGTKKAERPPFKAADYRPEPFFGSRWKHNSSCPKASRLDAVCDCGEPPSGLFFNAQGQEPT